MAIALHPTTDNMQMAHAFYFEPISATTGDWTRDFQPWAPPLLVTKVTMNILQATDFDEQSTAISHAVLCIMKTCIWHICLTPNETERRFSAVFSFEWYNPHAMWGCIAFTVSSAVCLPRGLFGCKLYSLQTKITLKSSSYLGTEKNTTGSCPVWPLHLTAQTDMLCQSWECLLRQTIPVRNNPFVSNHL